jgi:hypothetical protein
MNHLVAHAVTGTLLFRDWIEALELWMRLVRAFQGLQALCLMPNHIHLLHPTATAERLRQVLAGYARWRNAHRGESGPVWQRIPPEEPIHGREKERRQERYVHLNPSRAGLATCPLGWPFSTHRDAVGLAAFPVRRAAPDRYEYQRYISSDPSVRVTGTELPNAPWRDPSPDEVRAAVSAVTRTPLSLLRRRGPARTLLVRSLRALTSASAREIAVLTGTSVRNVERAPTVRDRGVEIVATVIGDPRFPALSDEDLQIRWRGANRDRWRDGPDGP